MSIDGYFRRFGFCERQIVNSPPPRDLALSVVIPCFNEPDLVGCLESIWQCDRPAGSAEVIVVINGSRADSQDVRAQNQRSFEEASAWLAEHSDCRLAMRLLRCADLPEKQAGVGLARKVGMDEALRRFHDIGRIGQGVIVCYDADCRCERNLLASIESLFRENPGCPACSIYFEHPLHGPLPPSVYEAVAEYELHLRYYVQALRYAGFPFAHHTVGSSMAVRASVYAQQGGMNKRQAGEDFYFLQKIIPLGGFVDLNGTVVFPSPRPSERVPFGTGKAVIARLAGSKTTTYPLEAFLDLKLFFGQIPDLGQDKHASISLPEFGNALCTFLEKEHFVDALKEIRDNTSSQETFRKRLFLWFNAFRAMKFIHHARDHFYGARGVQTEAAKLLGLLQREPVIDLSTMKLLKIYRDLDRGMVRRCGQDEQD